MTINLQLIIIIDFFPKRRKYKKEKPKKKSKNEKKGKKNENFFKRIKNKKFFIKE
jgi:hypothetical protein